MHAKSFEVSQLDKLVEDLNIAMVFLERDCPLWLANITTHIIRHMVEKVKENGPFYASWMYSFERVNSWITRRAMNRDKTEECIMETVQVM